MGSTEQLYSRLNSDGGEFRLLSIEPASWQEAPLICSLQHALLSDDSKFEALSYTWGQPGISCEVRINNHPVQVQENAAAALRRLRSKAERRTMWVDAICINQRDNHEKEGQLVLMRTIYEKAEKVCVWLGEPSEGTVIAIECLKDPVGMGVMATGGKSVANTYITYLTGPSTPLQNPGNGIAWGWHGQLDHEVNMGDLRDLLTRPWWTRVWVIQEVVVAREVIFMVGSDTFVWSEIERALNRERKGDSLLRVPKASGTTQALGTLLNPEIYSAQDENFQIMSRLRGLWQTGKFGLSIYELLYEFRHLDCTDPRDRVFSCLGLATAGGQHLDIQPDYTNSTRHVYTKSAVGIINSTKTLDIFNCVREWRGVQVPPRPTYAFSLLDQAKYHDVGAVVSDGPGTKPRKGWSRLPPGWERIPAHGDAAEGKSIVLSWSTLKAFMKGKTARYYDHNTGILHENSPLEGKEPPLAQHPVRQRELSPGWVKTWDNLGRAHVYYERKAPALPPRANQQPPPLPPRPGQQQALASAPTTPDPLQITHLPTWVPNWSAHTHIDPHPLLNWSDQTPRFSASGSSTASITHTPGGSSSSITVQGLPFDTIIALSDPWHPLPGSTPPITIRGAPVLSTWEPLALDTTLFAPRPCPYTTSPNNPSSTQLQGNRQEAYWRTQIADLPGALSAPVADGILLEAWHDRKDPGWAKPQHLPSVDDMASKSLWELAGVNVDAAYLHWDLHGEVRRIRDAGGEGNGEGGGEGGNDGWGKVEIKGSEERYGVYLRRIREACAHRRLLVTRRGYLGLVGWNAEVGDEVVVLKGGRTPFLVRRKGGGGDQKVDSDEKNDGDDGSEEYELVGEAFVYGIMGGEAMMGDEVEEEKMREFRLV